MPERVTLPQLHAMRREGRKIVGVVVWDAQMAAIADRAGVDIVSVGDTVGTNLWGRDNPLDVSLDEMVIVARAVRRGVRRALVSADFPYGPLQQGTDSAVAAAIRLVKEAGVDMVKPDGAAEFPEAVHVITRAGIPVWAQFGITPQTALRHGVDYSSAAKPGAQIPAGLTQAMLDEARALESAGAALLDFTNSGPVAGPVVTAAAGVPVIGGFGGGPWLDGRVRMAHPAIGYGAKHIGDDSNMYANVAEISLNALTELAADIRAARHLRGQGDRTERNS
ncbi:MAG: 3-methyl-2-oxobutanoate hydroxymethyltransferase [Rhodobacterales bacterium]|nr:3-methyl-2-oxobutanoate hydroxymethyltransferase [Rhodobacterales bacterium]